MNQVKIMLFPPYCSDGSVSQRGKNEQILSDLIGVLFLIYKMGRLYYEGFANCVLRTPEFHRTPSETAGEDESC